MAALTRAGGVTTRVYADENCVAPVFCFDNVGDAYDFEQSLQANFETIRAEAESTTRHGKLQSLECQPIGREVIVKFSYFTADAQGMNMMVALVAFTFSVDSVRKRGPVARCSREAKGRKLPPEHCCRKK
jgi:hydroxymethylglutaryl-CoA reductase